MQLDKKRKHYQRCCGKEKTNLSIQKNQEKSMGKLVEQSGRGYKELWCI